MGDFPSDIVCVYNKQSGFLSDREHGRFYFLVEETFHLFAVTNELDKVMFSSNILLSCSRLQEKVIVNGHESLFLELQRGHFIAFVCFRIKEGKY